MQLFCRRAVLVACAAVLLGGPAVAQPYPSHPVRIVVPFPAGGSNDIIARIVAQKLADRTGQPFLVENRGGAGGNVGADAVASSDPDGYTLLLTAPPPLTSIALYKDLKYDPARAFAPVSLIVSVPIVLVVHRSVRAKTVSELVALAKAKPGTLNFGSSGNGSTNHLAGEMLKSMAGIDIVHIPYRGAAPAMKDLIAGHFPIMFDNMPAVLPPVQAKFIIAIAIAGRPSSTHGPRIPACPISICRAFAPCRSGRVTATRRWRVSLMGTSDAQVFPPSNHEEPVAGVTFELFDQAVFPIEVGLHRAGIDVGALIGTPVAVRRIGFW